MIGGPPEAEPAVRKGDASMHWLDRASCLEHDPDLFFPVGTTGPAVEQTARARAVCNTCAVRTECLAWALDTCQDAGVWGGLDEEERREIRRARRRAAAAAAAGAHTSGSVDELLAV